MSAISIVVTVVTVILGGLSILLWIGRREHKKTELQIEQIRSLPVGDARSKALALLQDSSIFDTEPIAELSTAPDVPPSVEELLSRYSRVSRGEFWLGHSALHEESKQPGYVKIGEDFEFTEIYSRPAGSEIYTFYGESTPSEPPDVHSTVWHTILEFSGEYPRD